MKGGTGPRSQTDVRRLSVALERSRGRSRRASLSPRKARPPGQSCRGPGTGLLGWRARFRAWLPYASGPFPKPVASIAPCRRYLTDCGQHFAATSARGPEWSPQDQRTGGNPPMPQTEKPLVQPVDLSQNAGINVVNLGADDVLQGRLEVQGDLKIAGKVEGELRASGNVTIDSSASVQASIEGSNVSVRGQVTGSITARRRLTLGGKGRLNGDVMVGRLSVEDGATLNGNVTMSQEKGE